MKKINLPWFFIVAGLMGYFIGAIYAVDPVTTPEILGTGMVVVSMGIVGLGVGILKERKDNDLISNNRNSQ